MSLDTGVTERAGEATGRAAASPVRRRWAWPAGALVVLLLAGGGAAWYAVSRRDGGTAAAATHLPAATATVTRGDVIDTESVEGRLTYPENRTVEAGGSGVVTQTPAAGATISRGQALYKVADRPVVLWYGPLPLYRDLYAGVSDGPDVIQVERNLQALGYGGGLTVDDHYSAATAKAVQAWQDDVGLPGTGRIDAVQLLFQPGPIRVGDVRVQVGQQVAPGRPVLSVTGTRAIVHVDLETGKQSLATRSASVRVDLPNGKIVDGKVTAVSTVAVTSGPRDNQTSTIGVDITLSGSDTGGLDQAPVRVELESERARKVLSVPIEALLGLREGGFGVEVVENGTSRIVPVKTGTFGSGRVQVTGIGLAEGMHVGVPSS